MKHTIAYLKRQLDNRTGAPNPNTIYRMGKLAHPDATTVLLDLLNTPTIAKESMHYILAALRYTDDDRARDTLLHYFHNGFETSTVVINSLGSLRDHRAVPQLIELLEGHLPTRLDYHASMGLRFRVVIALGKIGDPMAIPALKRALSNDKLMLKYALSDVQLQVPICEYAHDALVAIGTPAATEAAYTWAQQYDHQLAHDADVLIKRVQFDQNFVDLQGELIRLKQYALDILKAMSQSQLRQYPNLTFNVLKEFGKQGDRLSTMAHTKIQDFIMNALKRRYEHLSLEQGFMLLDYYDDPRAIEFALEVLNNINYHPDIHGDPLGLLTRKRIQAAIPIIAKKIAQEGVTERYLTSLGLIGGTQAEEIVTHYIQSDHGPVRMSAIYALADLARESDTALETMSQLIDSHDYSLSQQAIIRMDKVGSRSIYILLPLLKSYDKWSAGRALSTLGRIGDPRVIPHLIALLSDAQYSYLHREIIATLEKLDHEDAYEVINLWQDTSR